jgi:hypothetical protein
VILYEARPAFQPPHNWQEMVVAKFMYVGTRREWGRRAVEFRGHQPGACVACPPLVTAIVRRLEDTLVDVPEKKAQQ